MGFKEKKQLEHPKLIDVEFGSTGFNHVFSFWDAEEKQRKGIDFPFTIMPIAEHVSITGWKIGCNEVERWDEVLKPFKFTSKEEREKTGVGAKPLLFNDQPIFGKWRDIKDACKTHEAKCCIVLYALSVNHKLLRIYLTSPRMGDWMDLQKKFDTSDAGVRFTPREFQQNGKTCRGLNFEYVELDHKDLEVLHAESDKLHQYFADYKEFKKRREADDHQEQEQTQDQQREEHGQQDFQQRTSAIPF